MTVISTRCGRLLCTLAEPRHKSSSWPVVLLHGLGATPAIWRNFQRHFASHGVRSYALELPTFSGWRQLGVYDYALAAAGALVEIGPAIVVGHSLGGLVVQKLAETSRQPGYVLIASAPPWPMCGRAFWPLWRALLRHPMKQILAPLGGRPLVLDPQLQYELIHQRLSPLLRAQFCDPGQPASARAAAEMIFGRIQVNPAAIQSPILVVGGLGDRLMPVAEQRRLASCFHSPLRMYDRGHMLMIEDGWQEIAADLTGWIAGLERRRLRTSALAVVPAEAA